MQTKLPNFLCVGAAKSGTTSLHAILDEHPEIYLPPRKEIHFFDNNENYFKNVEWYTDYFKEADNKKVIGEITADYMFFDYVPPRIIDTLGKNIKLIFMLRNPADRAYSEYLFNVRRGFFSGSFEEAIQNEKNYNPGLFENRYYVHLHRSMYFNHIKRTINHFNPDNAFYILFEEDFVKNKSATFKNLYDFLGVSHKDLNLNKVYKPSYVPRFQWLQNLVYQPNILRKTIRKMLPSYKIKMKIKDQLLPFVNKSSKEIEKLDPAMKENLIKNYFYDDIKKTEDLIKRDLSGWLK